MLILSFYSVFFTFWHLGALADPGGTAPRRISKFLEIQAALHGSHANQPSGVFTPQHLTSELSDSGHRPLAQTTPEPPTWQLGTALCPEPAEISQTDPSETCLPASPVPSLEGTLRLWPTYPLTDLGLPHVIPQWHGGPFLLGTLCKKLPFFNSSCLLIYWPCHTWIISKPTF